MSQRRLDLALVERGLARSRGHARDLICSGEVQVDGLRAAKPAQLVTSAAQVTVTATGPVRVSRAAGKLEHALGLWPAVANRVPGLCCVDIGACTGGFTEVLLAHGARQVVAVDVGHDQLAPRLRADPRVLELSGTSVRGIQPEQVGGPSPLIVADLSFISLTTVAVDLARLAAPGAALILLVKPQFEVGRSGLGKGGIVTSARRRQDAVCRVLTSLAQAGIHVQDLARSPVQGSHGNVEYLMWAMSDPCERMDDKSLTALVARTASEPTDSAGRSPGP